MKISYPTSHTWYKVLTQDSLSFFGKNDRARLKSTLQKIGISDITTSIQPLDDAFLEWFIPMYTEKIQSKSNPILIDIKERIESKPKRRKKYYSLTLYEKGEIIGGTIFIVRKHKLSIAYRIYPHQWTNSALQASPSLYTEYIITNYACEINKDIVIHGKDRNPYGPHSNIGLAIFKLSVGCQPRIPKRFEIHTIYTSTINEDMFILGYPNDGGEEIKNGYLVTTKENFNKWQQATKYPEIINVEVIYRI